MSSKLVRFLIKLAFPIVAFLPLSSVAFPLGSGTFGSSIFGDSDGDLVLDTLDAFPDDASETKDTDGDGVGDNSDAFPSDGEKTQDLEGILNNNAVLNDPASFGLVTVEEKDSAVAVAVESQIDACVNSPSSCGIDLSIDVDGDGNIDPLTDGLLIIRYLLGFTGNLLIDGAVGANATRTSSIEIENYIKARVPAN